MQRSCKVIHILMSNSKLTVERDFPPLNTNKSFQKRMKRTLWYQKTTYAEKVFEKRHKHQRRNVSK